MLPSLVLPSSPKQSQSAAVGQSPEGDPTETGRFGVPVVSRSPERDVALAEIAFEPPPTRR